MQAERLIKFSNAFSNAYRDTMNSPAAADLKQRIAQYAMENNFSKDQLTEFLEGLEKAFFYKILKENEQLRKTFSDALVMDLYESFNQKEAV